MGISRAFAFYICHEHRNKPLPKRILSLGRQTILFGSKQMMEFSRNFGLDINASEILFDRKTVHAMNNPHMNFVSDTSFFKMLGVEHIDVLDKTDYEGANLIFDLCDEIPSDLYGKFDFIINGSVLDNVWDVSKSIRNISNLLAPGGRVVHCETATAMRYSYSAISPSWFFDYYVVNAWRDCKVYVAATPKWDNEYDIPLAVMAFDPSAQAQPNAFSPPLGDQIGIQIILAEKGSQSTSDIIPTQSHYRSEADWDVFRTNLGRILKSDRPLILGDNASGKPIAAHDNAWLSLGWW